MPFQASDLDEDTNAEIGYSITGGDPSGMFKIDTATGELTLTGPLDYESMDPASNGRYTLTVTARDAGVPQLSSNGVNVIITVQVCKIVKVCSHITKFSPIFYLKISARYSINNG